VILIIDEIDANLDRQTILVLEDVLNDFNGTVLMVSRFEDRLAMADYYWHLKDGKLDTVTESAPDRVRITSKSNNP
jgi:ATPase subunit of ABC transporter with duplicated ATPase domains